MNLKDIEMRERLSLASVYSSIASSSTGFGAAHSLGLTINSMSSTPHMEVCAAILPAVLDQYARYLILGFRMIRQRRLMLS